MRGFQARKLHDDDPLSAKYVNSPESDLFKKGDLLYGLDTARQAIAKQDRAVVVEEDWYSYGVGAELVATIQEGAFDYLDAPIKRVAQAEVPLPYAKVMEQLALPKASNLIEAIKSTLDASGYRARSFR